MMEILGNQWRQHLRLSLLIVLSRSPGYSANDSVLSDALPMVGFRATRDQVRGELHWLAEQGLVELETLDDLIVATAKRRGAEIAQGLSTHPEIKRPSAKG